MPYHSPHIAFIVASTLAALPARIGESLALCLIASTAREMSPCRFTATGRWLARLKRAGRHSARAPSFLGRSSGGYALVPKMMRSQGDGKPRRAHWAP
ncbi:hypothetical protein MRX96_028129 [Rhipicephalus microplus]